MAQIAISHIVFNIVSTVVMFPFAKVLVKLSCLLVPGKDDSESEMHCKFIDDRLLNTPPSLSCRSARRSPAWRS